MYVRTYVNTIDAFETPLIGSQSKDREVHCIPHGMTHFEIFVVILITTMMASTSITDAYEC